MVAQDLCMQKTVQSPKAWTNPNNKRKDWQTPKRRVPGGLGSVGAAMQEQHEADRIWREFNTRKEQPKQTENSGRKASAVIALMMPMAEDKVQAPRAVEKAPPSGDHGAWISYILEQNRGKEKASC